VALAKQAPERARKNAAKGQPAAPKTQRAGPYAEQTDLDKEWTTSSEGGVLSRPPTLHPKLQSKTHSSAGHGGAQAV